MVFLFYFQHQSFQIFALWVIDVDRVVCGLVKLMKYSHEAVALGGCSEYGKAELVLVDGLRAAEGEQYSAGLYLLHGLGVKARVSLECIVQRHRLQTTGGASGQGN